MPHRLQRIEARLAHAAGLALAINVAVVGCNLIAHTDDFMVGTADESDACAAPASPCAAVTCTIHFENATRIRGYSADGALPSLPEGGPADVMAMSGGDDSGGEQSDDGGPSEGPDDATSDEDAGSENEAGGEMSREGGKGGEGGKSASGEGGTMGGGGAGEGGTMGGGGVGEGGMMGGGGVGEGGMMGSGGGGQHNGSGGGSHGGGGGGDGGQQGGAGSPAVACSSLPQPVFIVGSGGLLSIAQELGALTSMVPITVVFISAHSCDGAKAIILDDNTLTLGATTGTYWDASGTAHTCQLDAAGNYADIGMTSLFAEACLTLPEGTPNIGDFLGPVVPEAMVVPIGSTQTSISAEALYYIFGIGPGAVAPWTDPKYVFQNPTSTAQLDFGIAIGVPAASWHGQLESGTNGTVMAVVTSTQPENTLACMSTDQVESIARSSTIKELAFQDRGQNCAYYPNLTATSADKANIRDGHYKVWGFTHMFAKVNSQNVPLNANAGKIILYFTGDAPTPTGNFLQFVINDRLVPPCAMSVTRSSEMGALKAYTPHPGCSCYFDSVATGSTKCQSCKTSSDCPMAAPDCNLGFCEAN